MFMNTTSTSPVLSTVFFTGALHTAPFPTSPNPIGYLPSSSLSVGTSHPQFTISGRISATSSGHVLSSSAFSAALGHPLYSKSTGAISMNSSRASAPGLASGVFPTGIIPSGLFPNGTAPSGTGRPYTKPTSPLFTNSTLSGASTGILPNGTRYLS